MKVPVFVPIMLLGALAVGAQEVYSTWSHHRDVFLNTVPSNGAGVAVDVVHFPVLVRLGAADSAVFTAAKAGGADLRFTKAGDVTRLPHQIELWNATARNAVIWVKVDTVRGNNSTQRIRMHWGKSDAVDSSNGAAVFTSAHGFFNVWHLGDAPGTNARPSAVTGGNPAVPVNFPSGYGPVSGIIGNAESLRGGATPIDRDHFDVGTGAGYSSYPDGFTFSVWAYPTEVWNQAPFFSSSNGYASTASDVIVVGRNATTNDLKFRVREGAGAYSGINWAPEIALFEWQHFAFVRQSAGGMMRIYKNGAEIAFDESATAFADTDRPNNYLGRSFSPNDQSYAGLLDEARLSKVPRSAGWIKLEFENQRQIQKLVFFDSVPTPARIEPVARPLGGADFAMQSAGGSVLFRLAGENAGGARIVVMDMRGRPLWKAFLPPKTGMVAWNAGGSDGRAAPAGVYAVRLTLLDRGGHAAATAEKKIALTR